MNKTEAKKIISSMMVLFDNYKPVDVDYAAKVWSDVMQEYTYEQASAGLRAYAKSNTSGFPPVPGQIIDKIHTMMYPQELDEMEAWALVSKALRRSGENYAEEFANLPPLVQKAVGLPDQLHVWALDENYCEDVVRSHFVNCYRAVLKRAEEYRKMPPEVRKLIESVNKGSYADRIEQKRQNTTARMIERIQEENRAIEVKRMAAPAPESYYRLMDELKGE